MVKLECTTVNKQVAAHITSGNKLLMTLMEGDTFDRLSYVFSLFPPFLLQFLLFAAFMVLPLICLFFAYGLIILELWRGIMSEKRATARGKNLLTFILRKNSCKPQSDPFLRHVISQMRAQQAVFTACMAPAFKGTMWMLLPGITTFLVLFTNFSVIIVAHVTREDNDLESTYTRLLFSYMLSCIGLCELVPSS